MLGPDDNGAGGSAPDAGSTDGHGRVTDGAVLVVQEVYARAGPRPGVVLHCLTVEGQTGDVRAGHDVDVQTIAGWTRLQCVETCRFPFVGSQDRWLMVAGADLDLLETSVGHLVRPASDRSLQS